MWKKLSALPILIFITFSEPLRAIAQPTLPPNAPPPGYWPGPWHMWSDGYAWPFWWMFPLMMMLFVILVCVTIFYFARGVCAGGSHGGPPWRSSHSALQILSERYARGEIQKAEYEEKKAAILSAG